MTAFDLPAAKSAPALIALDEAHLARVAAALADQIGETTTRLDAARRAPAGPGGAAVERDQEVHRLASRLSLLRRFGVDAVLGRMTPTSGDPMWIGRFGLTDAAGERLLVDWRTPAAEPFFRATLADPRGLRERRRYRWSGGSVVDLWDESFEPDAAPSPALDDQSAFLASLAGARTERMRDVLATLAADQDAIIRAGSEGVLVVDGGPGTGKTVVALHRAAYLLHADPRLGERRGGVLVIGPSREYLRYTADVLPSLGEDGVRTATLADLLPEGAGAPPEPDPAVAALKSAAVMVDAIETAVRFYEEPPTEPLMVETPWASVRLGAADWAEAFAAVEPGTPHHEAREQVHEALVAILADRHESDEEDATEAGVRAALGRDPGLRAALARAWPVLEAEDLVGDLWSAPAFLRLCAPWLDAAERARLRRADARAWTQEDLPLLDAARRRLGDADAARVRRARAAGLAARRAEMDDVVAGLIAADDTEMQVMSMLRGADLRGALDDEAGLAAVDRDPLAGPFAHVVVDEAQELTPAQWRMVLARCPSRSLTVVGDRAQARRGFPETWARRLADVGLGKARVAPLGVNYRTPSEVMDEAAPVIRAALPDANVPVSIRAAGLPVRRGTRADLDAVLTSWLADNPDGVAAVIGAPYDGGPRVHALTPVTAKGLEFDLVVIVGAADPGLTGAVDHYVAMTRTTRELVLLD